MRQRRIVSRRDAQGAPRPERENRGAARGRPRSAEAHQAILRAAIALVREIGYDNVTMDGVAARAGVGKATVYRRWSGKETLVADAIDQIVGAIHLPDTGRLDGDLRAIVRSELALYADPATLKLLSGLVAAMARSALIARAVRRGFVATRRAAVRRVLERGIERGDLAPDADLELAMDVLAGPLFLRRLFTGGIVDEKVGDRLVDLALHGLSSTGHRRNTSAQRTKR